VSITAWTTSWWSVVPTARVADVVSQTLWNVRSGESIG
jgi:hypothetical protein